MKLECILEKFFIFNPLFGPKEGEELKKVLYFYPESDSEDAKVRNTGFAEAVIQFTNTFKTEPCPTYTVETNHFLQLYFQAETDYVLGMVLSKQRSLENKVCMHPEMCLQLLQFAYKMFRLFFGTFQFQLAESSGDVGGLKKRLGFFYSRYVPSLTFSKLPLLDLYNGVNFMPLDQVNYLKVQSIISRLKESFPVVRETVFLYNDKVLWYSIPKDDMCVLYRYLSNNLLPVYMRQELEPGSGHRVTAQHYGTFVTGPPNLNDPSDLGKVPSVYLNSLPLPNEGGDKPLNNSDKTTNEELAGGRAARLCCYQLIIYRSLNTTICLLVDSDQILTYDFYKSIDIYLGPLLVPLSSAIADLYSKMSNSSPYQYIYFNHETKSVRCTFDAHSLMATGSLTLDKDSLSGLHPPGGSSSSTGCDDTSSSSATHQNTLYGPGASVPQISGILNLLCDLRQEICRSDYFGDVVVKTDTNLWIAGKKSGQREVIVIASQKSTSLADVTDEVKKLCSDQFANMFLTD